MPDIGETVQEITEKEHAGGAMDSYIALLVAVAATLMAIGNIKDGNIVQAMSQAQTKAVSQWNYYQAKSTKQIMAENMVEQLRTQLAISNGLSAAARAETDKQMARYDSEAKRYEKEKEGIRKEAEGFQAEYDRLNIHDDQFDMAEACFTIAIAMSGITALTRKRWLFTFAIVCASLGTVLFFAGFAQLNLHPEWLAKLLG